MGETALDGSIRRRDRKWAFLLSAILAAFFSSSALLAQNVTVMRDGSLVFEQPGERSAVLDILPRGMNVELVDRGPVWCEIILRNPTRRGFIRAEALTASSGEAMPLPERSLPAPAASAAPAMQTQSTLAALPAETGNSSFDQKMRSLDRTEEQIRGLNRSLIEVSGLVDTLKLYRMQAATAPKQKRRAKMSAAGESQSMAGDGSAWNVGALAGYYLDSRETLAGAGLLWQPQALRGLNLELNIGWLIPDESGADGSLLVEAGALLPVKRHFGRLQPYIAVNTGMVRRDPGVSGLKKRTDLIAAVGAGTFLELNQRSRIRLEVRQSFEFLEQDHHSDQRIAAGFSLRF